MLEVSDEDDVDDSCRLATVPKERYQTSRDLFGLALVQRRFACMEQGRVWNTFTEHLSEGFRRRSVLALSEMLLGTVTEAVGRGT